MKTQISGVVYWFLHLWVLAYCGVLIGAFTIQFMLGELPCPLCMLQRCCMLLSTLGPVWIIHQSNQGSLTPQRYNQGLGMAGLGALLGAAVSTRQVLLHILPGDSGYGAPIMGLHLYTWALVTFLAVILTVSVLGIAAPATVSDGKGDRLKPPLVSSLTLGLFLLVLAANALMIVFLEGFAWVLPDDPMRYHLIEQLSGS